MLTGTLIDTVSAEDGLGTVCITDARLLVKPARDGQYPRHAMHDTGHAYNALRLGNDMGEYEWHIASRGDLQSTFTLLDRVFANFVEACCFELWCDARVNYIAHNEVVRTRTHGFTDGQYTMRFNVYCYASDAFVEDLILRLKTREFDGREQLVVLRPDTSELGYEARGFELE